MEIAGTAAVISGGASGLGAACASEIVRRGGRVMILDLEEEKARALVDELGKAARYAVTDVTDENAVSSALDLAEEAFGAIQVAVNCAGIAVAAKTLGRDGAHPLGLFRKVQDVNLTGSFNVARLAAERMGRNAPDEDGERGVIINTASIAAMDGQKGQPAYAASKGGIVSMTLPMARDLSDRGIRVNTVAPGLFRTPLLEGLPEAAQEALAAVPLFPKRLGLPRELARLVAFIIESPYLNGETIRLDGGARLP